MSEQFKGIILLEITKMFSISVILLASLVTTFAEQYPNINGGQSYNIASPQQDMPQMMQGNPIFDFMTPKPFLQRNLPVPSNLQEPIMQGNQLYSSMSPPPFMRENSQMLPIPLPQQPMMQSLPFPFSQQLPSLIMSAYARFLAFSQMMALQNQMPFYHQLNVVSAMNNMSPTPVPLPYVKQPQAEVQQNLQNEILQEQTQQAENQQRSIQEKQRLRNEYEKEVERREELLKRRAEEIELQNKQRELERELREEQDIENERAEIERQLFAEAQEEQKRQELDRKIHEEEELRFKQFHKEEFQQEEELKRQEEELKLQQEEELKRQQEDELKRQQEEELKIKQQQEEEELKLKQQEELNSGIKQVEDPRQPKPIGRRPLRKKQNGTQLKNISNIDAMNDFEQGVKQLKNGQALVPQNQMKKGRNGKNIQI